MIAAAFLISGIYYFCSGTALVLRDGDTGKVLASYPATDGDRFAVGFVHSVNQSPLTDVYEIRSDGIYVVETIYYAFGAGVQTELGPGETLAYGADGAMMVSGFDRKMDKLSYIVGTVSDHQLTIGGQTIGLREVCGKNRTVCFSRERKFF